MNMSNGSESVNQIRNNERAIDILDNLLTTKKFSTEDRQYIRLTLIPMLTTIIENIDDGFNEELRNIATNLCMRLIPGDHYFVLFVEDWIKKKKTI